MDVRLLWLKGRSGVERRLEVWTHREGMGEFRSTGTKVPKSVSYIGSHKH